LKQSTTPPRTKSEILPSKRSTSFTPDAGNGTRVGQKLPRSRCASVLSQRCTFSQGFRCEASAARISCILRGRPAAQPH
jgi:hypothetical protein